MELVRSIIEVQPKYPRCNVKLLGENGNAFVILGMVGTAMKRAKVPKDQIDVFMTEAMGGDYDHILTTTMKWVNVS